MGYQEIIESEYNDKFDKIRKQMIGMSYYKYGPIVDNFKNNQLVDAIGSLKMRLQKYEETGNTEMLADIANFAMIEFTYPHHPKGHYQPTDSGYCGIDGMSIQEIKDFK